MTNTTGREINTTAYDWCVKAFAIARDRLGMTLNTNCSTDIIDQGQIFVFNHFARFETVVPQYIIHRTTGDYARCVATHELFANERFGNFLWSVGAVPSNHPGLLPYLAADILRGRKVIIFPEGGMIKDRKVVDYDGDYNLISPSKGEVRKHHKGAAALAVTLELYKKRILTVAERGEEDRIGRWVEALGLADIPALIAAAKKPTFMVPGNITFYPIHTDDNILRKGFEWAGVEMGQQATEELLIEGNILFKETDMGVRFGDLIGSSISWNFWERKLLQRAFERVDKLEDLFGLRPDADHWADRIFAKAMLRETETLRDASIHGIYTLTTVNVSHLASRLVMQLINRSITDISQERFHQLLFTAIKHAQADRSLNLHKSVDDPDAHENIHCSSCDCLEFAKFLGMAYSSELIEPTDDRYRFLPKLCAKQGFHEVRLENMITVYANEIAPVLGACKAVDDALDGEIDCDPAEFSQLLFDDELRAFDWANAKYTQDVHREINDKITATEDGSPYLHLPDGVGQSRAPFGIVLTHGFLASPAELRQFGEALAAEGYPVIGVRLKGHGTSPWDLRDRTWQEWLSSVRRGYEIMEGFADKIVLVGFSTGGTLSLRLAAELRETLAAVAAVAAPVKFVDKKFFLVPLIDGLSRFVEWTGSDAGVMPFKENDSEHPHINYRHIPIRALRQLQLLVDEIQQRLQDITCPVLIVQGDEDPVVEPESAQIIFDGICSTKRDLQIVRSTRHGILNEDIGDARQKVRTFISGLALPDPSATDTVHAPAGEVIQ